DRAEASRGELPPQRFKPLWQRLEEEYRGLEDAERQDAERERHKEEFRRRNPNVVRTMEQMDQDQLNMQNMRNELITRGGGTLTEDDKPKDP
ncbi:hypothetical protein MMA31_23145, partial [Salmonella enterica]|nr:hypothetical protein [Salmonella enterica]